MPPIDGVNKGMFEQTIIVQDRTRKPWTFAASMITEVAAVSVLLLVPLIYTERLGLVHPSMLRIAPPVPQPLFERAERTPTRKSARSYNHSLIPTRIVPLVEILAHNNDPAPLIDDCINCVAGAMPGVVPAVFNGTPSTLPPKPEPKPAEVKKPEPVAEAAPVRLTSSMLEAKILRRVVPAYPALAKQARVQGTVKLAGTISRDGTIRDLQVLSGHPLLVRAAVEAVRQWVYRPTILNGQPVEVLAPIDVNFVLSN